MANLRELSVDDLASLVAWRNDPEVTLHLSDRIKTLDEAEKWLRRVTGNVNNRILAIESEGNLVGYCFVEGVDMVNRRCEVGIVIGAVDCWGKGIGREVLSELLRYCFKELGLHRVFAVVTEGNSRSIRLLERSGFTREGTMRETLVIRGSFTNLHIYSMLEYEYRVEWVS